MLLLMDLCRAEPWWGVKRFIKKRLSRQYKFLVLLRELEYCHNNPNVLNKAIYFFLMYRFKKVSMRLGYSIPINVFGPGLSLPHYGTVIVNPNSRVGAFCRLHCSTNIGASAGQKEAPSIGDNVYIGPGAIIFGDIHIANNITVGANATVNHSFDEEHVAIAGTPAKIVKRDMPNWRQFNGM